MLKKNSTKIAVSLSPVKQVAGGTGLLLAASAAIAFILTFFLMVR